MNIPTPCVTFDKPLWLKAVEIIQARSLKAWRLSYNNDLHGQYWFNDGLEEALETVYGSNAISHMISGKAVSRALRGHFLVEAALVNKLMSAMLPHQLENVLIEPPTMKQKITVKFMVMIKHLKTQSTS